MLWQIKPKHCLVMFDKCQVMLYWLIVNLSQWSIYRNSNILFSFTKVHLKIFCIKWQPYCLILNVLNCECLFHQSLHLNGQHSALNDKDIIWYYGIGMWPAADMIRCVDWELFNTLSFETWDVNQVKASIIFAWLYVINAAHRTSHIIIFYFLQ